MKFLITLALLTVVSALPPRHGFGHRKQENYLVDGPSSYPNRDGQFNLIKLVYQQLIEKLNHPSKDDSEEEEKAINNIVDAINIIGHILHDNNGYRPPKPEHVEHEGNVPNKGPSSINEVPPNIQDEELEGPSIDGSEDDVISLVKELSEDDDTEGELSVVDNLLEDEERKSNKLSALDSVLEDDESDNVFILANEKDDGDNPLIA